MRASNLEARAAKGGFWRTGMEWRIEIEADRDPAFIERLVDQCPGLGDEGIKLVYRDLEFADCKRSSDGDAADRPLHFHAVSIIFWRAHQELPGGQRDHFRAHVAVPEGRAWRQRPLEGRH